MRLRQETLNPGTLPEPPKSVLQGLRSIDPGLDIVRSKLWLNTFTGKPHRHAVTGECVVRPRYWVVLHDSQRTHILFPVQSPEGHWMPADGRIVHRIANDIARECGHDGDKVADRMAENEREKKAKFDKDKAERRLEMLEENRGAWRDAHRNMEHGEIRPNIRDEKIISYPNQPIRSTGKDTVTPDAQELGIYTGD